MLALVADQAPLAGVNLQRIGEDVDRVEADLFRLTDALGGFASGLGPRGIDQTQLHVFTPWLRGD